MTPTSPGAGRVLRALSLPLAIGVLAVTGTAAFHPQSAPAGTVAHKVVSGDSLWTLAQQAHTTVANLKTLNHLTSDTVVLGSVIYVPGTAAAPATTTTSSYTVVAGDSLSAIAARAGTTMAAIRALNPSIPASGLIVIGQALRLPGTAGTSTFNAAGGTVSQASAQALVRSEAIRQGVEPALALAIAQQESGFQQWVVSRTGAVGVMQLEPDTAVWVGQELLGRTINRYDVADNVAAGVALLHSLLAVAPTRTAVAAYYQGLASVQKRGMYTDTQQYVANVLALRARYS